jgi:hypothetical protein
MDIVIAYTINKFYVIHFSPRFYDEREFYYSIFTGIRYEWKEFNIKLAVNNNCIDQMQNSIKSLKC